MTSTWPTMQMLSAKIKAFDERIEELSHKPAYEVRVSQLACLCGITRKRATSIITEVCDFNRFAKPSGFAAFVGLTPGEDSSGETVVSHSDNQSREYACAIGAG